jgi:hypothetical protein
VARIGPIAFDFTRARHLETLLGAGMGLHLRHKNSDFKKWSAKINAIILLQKRIGKKQ